MPFYITLSHTFTLYLLLFTKILSKYVALLFTNIPKLKKVNLSIFCNKRWAIILKNQVKYIDTANVSYYITKLKKSVKY